MHVSHAHGYMLLPQQLTHAWAALAIYLVEAIECHLAVSYAVITLTLTHVSYVCKTSYFLITGTRKSSIEAL